MKLKRYIEVETEPDKIEKFVVAFQNVYYIVVSWLFGFLFARTANIWYLIAIFVPILIKIKYDYRSKKIKLKLFR